MYIKIFVTICTIDIWNNVLVYSISIKYCTFLFKIYFNARPAGSNKGEYKMDRNYHSKYKTGQKLSQRKLKWTEINTVNTKKGRNTSNHSIICILNWKFENSNTFSMCHSVQHSSDAWKVITEGGNISDT